MFKSKVFEKLSDQARLDMCMAVISGKNVGLIYFTHLPYYYSTHDNPLSIPSRYSLYWVVRRGGYMQDELQNLNAWVQQVLKEVQDVKIQLNDLRGEMRGQIDDLRGHIARNDQTDNDNTRMVDNLRTMIDSTRGEINGVKATVENKLGHLDGKLDKINSTLNEVRSKIR